MSFIKIDIEGAEYYALQGLKKVINKFNPVILVEIQPFFLKGMGILEDDLVHLIKNELDYLIYYYNQDRKKLQLVETNLWDDNFLLIPKSKKSNLETLITE